MIYGGNTYSNFTSALLSKDNKMAKNVFLSELHKLLNENPKAVVDVLKANGINASYNIDKKHLIHLTIENLYDNKKFRKDLTQVVFANKNSVAYSNADGQIAQWFQQKLANKSEGLGDGAEKIGSGASGGVVGAVAGAVDSVFGFFKSKSDAKAQKEADKQKLIQSIIEKSGQKKTNWLPIVIIGSILLIGGTVAIVSLKNKN